MKLKPGQHFVLVDIGDGTVDVSAAEIGAQPDSMNFITRPLGYSFFFVCLVLFIYFRHPYGAGSVDRAFIELLQRCFGKVFVENFKDKSPQDWTALMSDFEGVKCAWNGSLPIRVDFFHFYKAITKARALAAAEVLLQQEDAHIINDGARIYLELSVMAIAKLFSRMIDQTFTLIDSLGHEILISASAMIVVGGGAASPLVREAFAKKYPREDFLCWPNDDFLAVTQGALHLAASPHAIGSLIMPSTYGFEYTAHYSALSDKNGLAVGVSLFTRFSSLFPDVRVCFFLRNVFFRLLRLVNLENKKMQG